MIKIRGFTLIESVIYVGLLIVIAGFVGSVVYRIFEGSRGVSAMIISEDEANFLLRKIDWGLAGASAINSPPVGASSSMLSVNKINFSQNPIVFDLDSGNLRLKRGTGAATILNGNRVMIGNINFEHLAASGKKPEGARIALVIGNRQYETTVYLRK